MRRFSRWAPYIPVAQRRKQVETEAKKRTKNGKPLKPVRISGTKIASTFWGRAWCENLEKYSDFSNRLPRGRTYARNGSVIDLDITKGRIQALVMGSSLYTITIKIDTLNSKSWKSICSDCSGSIHSLIDLLKGKLSPAIMSKLTEKGSGMFPSPKEIKLDCTCPDWSDFCKHRAAVMYCIGHRLDTEPEMLFLLRGVDHNELIGSAIDAQSSAFDTQSTSFESEDLGALFGIDLADTSSAMTTSRSPVAKKRKIKPGNSQVLVENNAHSKVAKKSTKALAEDDLSILIAKLRKNNRNGATKETSAAVTSAGANTDVEKSAAKKSVTRKSAPKKSVAKKTTAKKKLVGKVIGR